MIDFAINYHGGLLARNYYKNLLQEFIIVICYINMSKIELISPIFL